LYILLRVVLKPAIDEPLIGHAWLIGELDPVLLINIFDLFSITFAENLERCISRSEKAKFPKLIAAPSRRIDPIIWCLALPFLRRRLFSLILQRAYPAQATKPISAMKLSSPQAPQAIRSAILIY